MVMYNCSSYKDVYLAWSWMSGCMYKWEHALGCTMRRFGCGEMYKKTSEPYEPRQYLAISPALLAYFLYLSPFSIQICLSFVWIRFSSKCVKFLTTYNETSIFVMIANEFPRLPQNVHIVRENLSKIASCYLRSPNASSETSITPPAVSSCLQCNAPSPPSVRCKHLSLYCFHAPAKQIWGSAPSKALQNTN